MVKLGDFLFRYRNTIFPFFYLILFLPSPKIFPGFLPPIIIGFTIILIGQGIRIATIGLVYIIRGGRNRKVYAEDLVTDGVFSHCRNPLYLGNVIQIFGLGILANSLIFTCIFSPLFLFFYQAIIRAEEAYLLKKFGSRYENYLKTVNRWIPNLKGINETFASMKFNWKRVVVKEYNSTFAWCLAATLMIAKNYHYHYSPKNIDNSWMYFGLVIVFLIIAYITVRYLKKTNKLSAG